MSLWKWWFFQGVYYLLGHLVRKKLPLPKQLPLVLPWFQSWCLWEYFARFDESEWKWPVAAPALYWKKGWPLQSSIACGFLWGMIVHSLVGFFLGFFRPLHHLKSLERMVVFRSFMSLGSDCLWVPPCIAFQGKIFGISSAKSVSPVEVTSCNLVSFVGTEPGLVVHHTWMTLWSQASLEQQQWWVWRQVTKWYRW